MTSESRVSGRFGEKQKDRLSGTEFIRVERDRGSVLSGRAPRAKKGGMTPVLPIDRALALTLHNTRARRTRRVCPILCAHKISKYVTSPQIRQMLSRYMDPRGAGPMLSQIMFGLLKAEAEMMSRCNERNVGYIYNLLGPNRLCDFCTFAPFIPLI